MKNEAMEQHEQDLSYDPEGDNEDVYGEGGDGRAHPQEPGDNEDYCPVCGGFGGDSYGSDFGCCEECDGTGVVDESWGEGNDEEE